MAGASRARPLSERPAPSHPRSAHFTFSRRRLIQEILAAEPRRSQRDAKPGRWVLEREKRNAEAQRSQRGAQSQKVAGASRARPLPERLAPSPPRPSANPPQANSSLQCSMLSVRCSPSPAAGELFTSMFDVERSMFDVQCPPPPPPPTSSRDSSAFYPQLRFDSFDP